MNLTPLPSLGHLEDLPLLPPVVPEKIDHKSKDLLLYNAWKETGSKRAMSDLVNHLSPLIYTEVSRASGTLPQAALSGEAKVWTIKAIKTFDPSRGFALGTHVTNYLQRVRRLNYKYQNAARLPENMQLQFHEYNKALTQLGDELNRDPTEDEMAKRLGWSKGQVVKFKGSLYSDLAEGANENASEVTQFSDRSLLLQDLRSRLTEDELFILDNKGTLSTDQLATHLGVNNNRFNYLQKKLVDKIQKLKTELSL